MQLHLISEEQHDDQLLTELLRCIKAVETAEVGLHNAIHGKVMSLTSLRDSNRLAERPCGHAVPARSASS